MLKVGGSIDPGTEVTHFGLNEPLVFFSSDILSALAVLPDDKCTKAAIL